MQNYFSVTCKGSLTTPSPLCQTRRMEKHVTIVEDTTVVQNKVVKEKSPKHPHHTSRLTNKALCKTKQTNVDAVSLCDVDWLSNTQEGA